MKKIISYLFFIFFGAITYINSEPDSYNLQQELKKSPKDKSSLSYAFIQINSKVQSKVDNEDAGWWVLSVTD